MSPPTILGPARLRLEEDIQHARTIFQDFVDNGAFEYEEEVDGRVNNSNPTQRPKRKAEDTAAEEPQPKKVKSVSCFDRFDRKMLIR